MSRRITRFSSLNNTLEQGCDQIMNIDPDIKVDKIEFINQVIAEVYRFLEDIEQQVREDLQRFKQEIENEDSPTVEGQIDGRGDL